MLRQLRKPRRQEPPDAQHLQAARHDVISERMLSLSPRQAPQMAAHLCTAGAYPHTKSSLFAPSTHLPRAGKGFLPVRLCSYMVFA